MDGLRSDDGALLCILMSMHASLHLPFKLPMTFSFDRQSNVGSLILGIPIETRAMLVDSLWLEGAKAHAYALAAEAAATLAVFGD
jgi:hypothetical protein